MIMRSFLNNTAVAIASLVAASGIVAFADPANASAPDSDIPHVVVQIGDLDLGSTAGRSTAERRIRNAAEQVCAFDGNPMSPSSRCREKAIEGATQALDARIAAL
jgi:UrcA family protein